MSSDVPVVRAAVVQAAPAPDPATALDLGRVREESMTLDVAGHYHRPDSFAFQVRRTGARPAGPVHTETGAAPTA